MAVKKFGTLRSNTFSHNAENDALGKQAKREVDSLAKLAHVNIVRLFGVAESLTDGRPCIITEFAENGSLWNLLHGMCALLICDTFYDKSQKCYARENQEKTGSVVRGVGARTGGLLAGRTKKSPLFLHPPPRPPVCKKLARLIRYGLGTREQRITFSTNDGLEWMSQTAYALSYMHAFSPRPILHRDLKPENVLLTHDRRLVKLADFGISTVLRTTMTNDTGTKSYMAPEVWFTPQKLQYNVCV